MDPGIVNLHPDLITCMSMGGIQVWMDPSRFILLFMTLLEAEEYTNILLREMHMFLPFEKKGRRTAYPSHKQIC